VPQSYPCRVAPYPRSCATESLDMYATRSPRWRNGLRIFRLVLVLSANMLRRTSRLNAWSHSTRPYMRKLRARLTRAKRHDCSSNSTEGALDKATHGSVKPKPRVLARVLHLCLLRVSDSVQESRIVGKDQQGLSGM